MFLTYDSSLRRPSILNDVAPAFMSSSSRSERFMSRIESRCF